MNKVILVGRLGADPETKQTQSGITVCKLRLATDEKVKGEKKTTWHRVILWGKLGEIASQYLTKGRLALFEGRLETREYEKDGKKQWITSVIASDMKMLGEKPKDGSRDQLAQRHPGNSINKQNDTYHEQLRGMQSMQDEHNGQGEMPF